MVQATAALLMAITFLASQLYTTSAQQGTYGYGYYGGSPYAAGYTSGVGRRLLQAYNTPALYNGPYYSAYSAPTYSGRRLQEVLPEAEDTSSLARFGSASLSNSIAFSTRRTLFSSGGGRRALMQFPGSYAVPTPAPYYGSYSAPAPAYGTYGRRLLAEAPKSYGYYSLPMYGGYGRYGA